MRAHRGRSAFQHKHERSWHRLRTVITKPPTRLRSKRNVIGSVEDKNSKLEEGATLHRRPKPSRDHHGPVGRDDHARRVGGARQPARASLARHGPQEAATTTPSSWRTIRVTSNAALRASARASTTPTSIRYLTAGELAYIVNNSLSQVLITSRARSCGRARRRCSDCPRVKLCLVVDGPGDGDAVRNLDEATAAFPATPIPDESKGCGDVVFLGHDRPAERHFAAACRHACERMPLGTAFAKFWRRPRGAKSTSSPAPLYHSAPWAAAGLTIARDGTAVVMERFDAEEVLRAVETYRVTHGQFVPTMFSRLLKLPPRRSRALRSLLAPST